MVTARERKHEKKRRRAKLARIAKKRAEEALRRLGGDGERDAVTEIEPAVYAKIVLGLAPDADRDDPVLATMEPEQFVCRIFPTMTAAIAKKVAADVGADRAKFEALRERLAKRNPFYDALDAFAPWLKEDVANGRRMWSAMANVDWQHESGATFSVTFRTAGGLIADVRGVGEDYMDFYCSGPYGYVCQTVFDHFAKLGWRPVDELGAAIEPVADGETWGSLHW